MSVTWNFIEKEMLLQVFEVCETFKDTSFNRTTSGSCFWSFLHFIYKLQDCKNFNKLVPSQTSLQDLQNLIQKQLDELHKKNCS